MAPDARLVFTDIGRAGTEYLSPPDALDTGLFNFAYDLVFNLFILTLRTHLQ